MQIFTLALAVLALAATILPLIRTPSWMIRIFEFPRLQIAVFTLLSFILTIFYVDFQWIYKTLLLLVLALAIIYQARIILVYTPLYRTQAKKSNKDNKGSSFTLLISNVRMENNDKEKFLTLVKKYNPDLVLINEPDQAWARAINSLDKDFPHSIKQPMGNTYGMIFLSKLPLTESQVNFLVEESIPSIFTKIILPSGKKIDFYGVHPMPPKPGTDTYERNTELLIVGKKIRDRKNPAVVAGDLNDVGWSVTSKLFRKYSGLVDPREGRGMFNTFNVFVPVFRFPLDHIFYSKEFGLLTLKKLEKIGSDHFPILVGLNYEPDGDNTEDLGRADKDEKKEMKEMAG